MSTAPEYGTPPGDAPPPLAKISTTRSMVAAVRATFSIAPITVILVGITVGVWVVHEALITFAHINTDLMFQDNGDALRQPWRLLTPLVVHYQIGGLPSFVHLGFNMLALWRIGPPVENVIGRRLFLAGYLGTGAGGQVASEIYYRIHPLYQNGYLVQVVSGGASGAVFGVVGMLIGNHLATVHADWIGRRSTQGLRFNPQAAKSLGIQGALWIVASSALFPGIDNWAHIGGALLGLVVGATVGLLRTVPRMAKQ